MKRITNILAPSITNSLNLVLTTVHTPLYHISYMHRKQQQRMFCSHVVPLFSMFYSSLLTKGKHIALCQHLAGEKSWLSMRFPFMNRFVWQNEGNEKRLKLINLTYVISLRRFGTSGVGLRIAMVGTACSCPLSS